MRAAVRRSRSGAITLPIALHGRPYARTCWACAESAARNCMTSSRSLSPAPATGRWIPLPAPPKVRQRVIAPARSIRSSAISTAAGDAPAPRISSTDSRTDVPAVITSSTMTTDPRAERRRSRRPRHDPSPPCVVGKRHIGTEVGERHGGPAARVILVGGPNNMSNSTRPPPARPAMSVHRNAPGDRAAPTVEKPALKK